ncbi:AMP-binding protein [Paenibacillus rhizoplanae]
MAEQWRDKVNEVVRYFPWYKDLIGNEHMNYSLEHLPLMTSDLLDTHYYNNEPDASLAVYRTSGTSTGRRKSIVYSEEDEQHYIDIKNQAVRGSATGKRMCQGAGGYGNRTCCEYGAGYFFARLGLVNSSIPFELPVEQHIERIQAFKPDLLYTMPSILDHIVYAADDPRALGIRKIILVGEIATQEWQQNMARLFGLKPQDITDTYGSIEIGTIAYYSHELGRYLLAEGIVAEAVGTEIVGEGLDPLGSGEGILVLTSTVRKLLPALRFVTYDVVRDFRTVQVDGLERQSFQSIVKKGGP